MSADRELDVAIYTALVNPDASAQSYGDELTDLDTGTRQNDRGKIIPHYSTDPAACRQMEDEIELRGVWRAYTEALMDMLAVDYRYEFLTVDHVWDVLRATPADRCRAALRAVEESATL